MSYHTHLSLAMNIVYTIQLGPVYFLRRKSQLLYASLDRVSVPVALWINY